MHKKKGEERGCVVFSEERRRGDRVTASELKLRLSPPTSVFPSNPSHRCCADRYPNIGTSDTKRSCLSVDSHIIRSIVFLFSLFYLFHTGWQLELLPLGLIWMLKCHLARYFLSRGHHFCIILRIILFLTVRHCALCFLIVSLSFFQCFCCRRKFFQIKE